VISNKTADRLSFRPCRQAIDHEIYEPPGTVDEVLEKALTGNAPPLVPNPMLKKARQFFESIPGKCVEYGGKTYQSFFKKY
jgi:hypothetical protein